MFLQSHRFLLPPGQLPGDIFYSAVDTDEPLITHLVKVTHDTDIDPHHFNMFPGFLEYLHLVFSDISTEYLSQHLHGLFFQGFSDSIFVLPGKGPSKSEISPVTGHNRLYRQEVHCIVPLSCPYITVLKF